jgi:hemerythrin-like domain-containing protein
MKSVSKPDRFQALDACHLEIHNHLVKLDEVLKLLETGSDEEQYRQQVGAIEAYFSSTSRQHHAEEEKNVFPALLRSDNAELVHAVRTLQQDHGWIEQNWIELAPMLRAVAEGEDWADPAELQHAVSVFLALCRDHIMREETLIYPAAKAELKG